MLKKISLLLPILMLVACNYDISGSAMVEITERFKDDSDFYIKVKNQGEEIYTLEVDENVFNLIEVKEEYFISYKSDKDRVGILETIEPK
ncbi:hypothetical protein [Alkalicoccobacillus plakortidis]|uniref:Uncharacterized protein n=1 Tax=Alkalicoccobacillus plakortidis TaxID=444060 RepID=A0ABT0XQ42_9BACI|nr:hypothetical protein [Alkalicoccobacillus plakortidis]MCM2677458.1 hypothetical protein [Alkalicoccobacillus plakortidis]